MTKRRYFYKCLLPVAIIFVILSGCAAQKEKETETEKILALSAQAGSLVKENGGWFYYSNPYDGNKLYKMKDDGTEVTRLTDIKGDFLGCEGEWVYYLRTYQQASALFRMTAEGTNDTMLVGGSEAVTAAIMMPNCIYYKVKTSKIAKLSFDSMEKETIYEGPCSELFISGKWLYFIESYGYPGGKICRLDPDTHEFKAISDSEAEGLILSDEYIYYKNINDGRKLYRMDLDGNDDYRISEDSPTSMVAADGRIVYLIKNSGDIFSVPSNGGERVKLTQTPFKQVSGLASQGGWVLFRVTDDAGNQYLYKTKPDGTGMEIMD